MSPWDQISPQIRMCLSHGVSLSNRVSLSHGDLVAWRPGSSAAPERV